jgi:hypothetical protein
MKQKTIRTMAILIILAGCPVFLLAQNNTVIIPRQVAATRIPFEWLSGDPGVLIASLVEPTRGSLTEAGDGLLYTPGQDFLDRGSDHFRYAQVGAGSVSGEVFLVADLREALRTESAFDAHCGLTPGWSVEGEVSTGWSKLLTDNPCSVSVGPSTEPAFLRFEIPILPGETSPGGGNTGMSLDPGTPADYEESVILSAHNEEGVPIFEVTLEGLTVAVRGRQEDGTLVASPPMGLPAGGARIDLGWWLARNPGSRDGGVWLTIDGELQGQLLGLDNSGPAFRPHEWRFGRTQSAPQVSGGLDFGDLDIWESSETPVFAPLFADGAETGDLTSWSALINPQNLAVVAEGEFRAVEVRIDPGSLSAMMDTTAVGLENYQARFMVDVSGLDLPAGQWLPLFRAPAGLRVDLFCVQLGRAADDSGFVVRIDTGQPVVGELSAVAPLPATGRFTLGVRWWAGYSLGLGGVILEVDGEERAELSIANEGSSMLHTELGVLETEVKFSGVGTLLFDDFEAWH